MAEGDVEHELAGGAAVKLERGELEVFEQAAVDEMDNLPPVDGVARQSIGVPGHDPRGLSTFNASQHFIEHRAARLLGALLFGEFFEDAETFPCRKVAHLGDLIADGADLP
ncbi:MAG: hypothetical protein IBJ18_04100 [Phycisphaerales bacterium]|nr:hypothetical protein [Phycisphaerales bacterium]